MGVERTSLLRMIKPLIETNYIAEEKISRKKIYVLTSKGNEIRQQAEILWNEIQDEINDIMKDDAKKLIELLNKIETI